MGDSTTEARGRSWRLVLAPWFEEQRAALRGFGNDESSALLFALRTDGGKLEVFVTCKENRRVSWLSKNVTKGEWTSAAAPKTKEERLNLLAQYHEVCDRSTNWQPKSVQSTLCGAHQESCDKNPNTGARDIGAGVSDSDGGGRAPPAFCCHGTVACAIATLAGGRPV